MRPGVRVTLAALMLVGLGAASPTPRLMAVPACAWVDERVVIACRVDDQRLYRDCTVRENPAGLRTGPGLIATLEGKPAATMDGQLPPPDAWIAIPFAYRSRSPVGLPDGESRSALVAAYPQAALRGGTSGEALVSCALGDDGAPLSACRLESETPGGHGFGDAALGVAARYRTCAGAREERAAVRLRVVFWAPAGRRRSR